MGLFHSLVLVGPHAEVLSTIGDVRDESAVRVGTMLLEQTALSVL
jgi:hypothetical protein